MLLRLGWVVEHLLEELELCEGGEWEDEKEEEVEEERGCCAERGHFPFLNLVVRLSAVDMEGGFCGLAHDDRFV